MIKVPLNYSHSKIDKMKKIIGIIVLLSAVVLCSAQSTSPRFGTLKNQDNTGRVLTYALVNYTDVAGADSLKTLPNAWQTIYNFTISTDSVLFGSPVLAKSFLGDNIVIIVQGSATGKKLKFSGTNIIGAGTVTTTTNKKAVVRLIFDGAKWVETGRYVQ